MRQQANDEAPTSNLYALNLASHYQFVSLGSAQSKEGRRLFNRQQKTGIKADYPMHHSVSHHFGAALAEPIVTDTFSWSS